MKQEQTQRAAYWFHFGVSILTIAITIKMALFIGAQVANSSFPWWVYPAFSIYIVCIFAIDHLFFSTDHSIDNEANALAVI